MKFNRRDFITATEIAAYAYCPEQWRLQHGMGLSSANRDSLDAGTRHHARKAVAERVAACLLTLGRILLFLAFMLLLGWLVLRR